MRFVIYAPPFDATSGGAIALHLLCQRLSEQGHEASIWPWSRRRLTWRLLPHRLKYLVNGAARERDADDPFGNRIAHDADLPGAVAIYPELVTGNPLAADRVVRWLLYMPGAHGGQPDFSPDDVLVHYEEAFAQGSSTRLCLTWVNPLYRNQALTRSGDCYMIRKHRGETTAHPQDARLLDGLSPQAIAVAFNQCERFFCYDPYTMFTRYAAISGCTPIIVPPVGMTEKQWLPEEADRYGLAFGPDRVDFARETRPLLVKHWQGRRTEEDAMVARFVARCRDELYG